MDFNAVSNLIKENDVVFADLRFTDTKGKEQHITLPISCINEKFFDQGKMFDGSSIEGWCGIDKSDMILMPDINTVQLDPFYADPTIIVRCDILETETLTGYSRDPRSVAKRAEEYLKSTGIGDVSYFGPEPEFFLFDDVRFKSDISGSFVATDDIKAKMDSWYSEGTEVVFACGGSICNSCLAAAQANGGKMIGVDVDQSYLDPCVVTSAMKALSNSVMVTLSDCKDNGWKFSDTYAGKETTLGAAEDCVGLPMDNSTFTTFSQDQYDKLFASLKDGSLVVDSAIDADIAGSVSTISVDVQQ